LALQLAKESTHSQQLVQKVRELEEAVAHRAHTNHLDPSKAKVLYIFYSLSNQFFLKQYLIITYHNSFYEVLDNQFKLYCCSKKLIL
jgi:hypothetical protein